MGDTKIQWSDAVWNPVRGCARVSEGCRNCYAERMAHRFSGPGQPYEDLTHLTGRGPHWTGWARFVPEMLVAPLRWRKSRRIFVNSMSDLFHHHVTNEQIAAVFGVMAACPQHTFQILTKRPGRMLEWFEWAANYAPDTGGTGFSRALWDALCHIRFDNPPSWDGPDGPPTPADWPLPNVHIGVSVEDQAAADERIPLLLQCQAAVRWVSAEPLLGPVNLQHMDVEAAGHRDWCQIDALTGRHTDMGRPCRDVPRLDWVVVGGESGPGARSCDVEWIRSIVRRCEAAKVPVFVKQLGTHPYLGARHEGTTGFELRLRSPKGGDPSEWPEDLRVREFPGVPA